jgi:hypothetical protein
MTEIEDVQARLAEMDDAYENVTDGRPEEGTYQAVIERFDFFDSKKTGDLFMKTQLTIAHDPQYEGQTLEAIHNLTDPERIRWTKKYLAMLGYQGSISGLIANLDSFVGLPVEVAVKYSDRLDEYGDPYMNIFINRRLAELTAVDSDVPADTSGFSPAGGGVDTDSVPF